MENQPKSKKRFASKEVKIEISNYGTQLKPEIKPSFKEACHRARFLLEMGYDITLFQQKQKGKWIPIKNPKIHNVALPKL